MKLIVGLGNPGKKYEGTRHNVGRRVVERLASQIPAFGGNGQWSMVKGKKLETRNWRLDRKLRAFVFGPYALHLNSYTLILAKPTVFMNESGRVVRKLLKHFKVRPANLWVVHDDIDLPLGRIKIKVGGGAAGHHGVESVIEGVGSKEFVRFRLGIGHPRRNAKLALNRTCSGSGWEMREKVVEKFVLSKFSKEEKPVVEEMVERAAEAIKFGLEEGIEKARGRFN